MNYFGFGGFGMFDVMFTIVFLLVTGTFVMVIVKGIGEWSKNNHSPRLTVPATVVEAAADRLVVVEKADVGAEHDRQPLAALPGSGCPGYDDWTGSIIGEGESPLLFA